jgi:hypothetical protein
MARRETKKRGRKKKTGTRGGKTTKVEECIVIFTIGKITSISYVLSL